METTYQRSLGTWLRRNAPGDIMMPVAENKAPMFAHANKQWSWHRFLRLQFAPDRNVGILLHDLCVVDVDCKAICAELCNRFPILLTTAHEKSRKGMHFFFRRSLRANAYGYYDGAAQRMTSVDFKTVCSNGTSGFVVVAPSTDKEWVIAPWELADLPEIPDDLLDVVARLRHMAITTQVRMMKTGETLHIVDSVALGRLAYTAMFEGMDEIPIPVGDAATLNALLQAMDTGRMGIPDKRGAWEAFIESVIHLADFLGLRVDDMRALEAHAYESMRLWDRYPEVAYVVEYQDMGELLDIAACAATARFCPTELGSDAVLRARPLHLESGAALIEPDFMEVLEDSIPTTVRQLLLRFQSRLIIAGGFVTGEVVPHYGSRSDIDLFVTGSTMEEANEIAEAFISHASVRPVFRTGNAVTFYVDEGESEDCAIPVQIVLTLYADPAAVLHGFDLDPCRACAFYEGTQLRVMATPSWLQAVSTASYPLRSEHWTMSSTARIIKYTVKGFQAYIPGLDRSLAVRTNSVVMDFILAMQSCAGAQELVYAERAFERQSGGAEYLTYLNQGCLTTFIRMSRRHDYDVLGVGGKIMRTLRYLYFKGLPLLGLGTVHGSRTGHVRLEAGTAAQLLTWKPPIAGKGLNAYFPAAAHFERVVTSA